jgi:hypothetical protein
LPRKPNYKFERLERERAKAAKKAARAQARADKKVSPPEGGAEKSVSDDTVENVENIEIPDATDEETAET